MQYKVEIILDAKELHSIVIDGILLQMDVRSQVEEIFQKKHDNVIRLSINTRKWDTLGFILTSKNKFGIFCILGILVIL